MVVLCCSRKSNVSLVSLSDITGLCGIKIYRILSSELLTQLLLSAMHIQACKNGIFVI